ncbi:MAG: acyl-CoA dehydrogenase family protein [Deltaproteobacteria bacterium]|nr:acyl-CoA dehydrogenase family protein [Deltaproteobacteria bacterium]
MFDSVHSEDVFTPEDMDGEQKLLSQVTDEFLQGEVEPRIKELEAGDEGLMVALFKKSAPLGLQGLDIPEEFGGMELKATSSLIVTEKTALGGPFGVASLDHTTFATLPILYFGTKEQKKKYLKALAEAVKIGAFALTEPNSGSDALNAGTTATLSEDGDYYLLNGEKQFISNSAYAGLFILFAKIDDRDFSAFIVDRDSEGLSLGEEEDKMGIKGTSTRSVLMQNVRVPCQNLLLGPGKGAQVAFSTLNLGRYKMAGLCLGNAKLALKDSIGYARNRLQFGRPIADFGLIREKIAEMAVRIFAAESMLYRTAGLIQEGLEGMDFSLDQPGPDQSARLQKYAMECSINKIYASEMLHYVTHEAVQIHGGYGYIKDYPVERYYRDARINLIYGGTNEINRLLIARLLFKKALSDGLSLTDDLVQALSEKRGLSAPSGSDGLGLEEMAFRVEKAKGATLQAVKAVYDAYPEDLEEQQEVGGMIANILIEIFAMESSLLRILKITEKRKGEGAEIPEAISGVIVSEGLMKVRQYFKSLFSNLFQGDELKDRLTALRILSEPLPADLIGLRRKIAEAMIKTGRYFIV